MLNGSKATSEKDERTSILAGKILPRAPSVSRICKRKYGDETQRATRALAREEAERDTEEKCCRKTSVMNTGPRREDTGRGGA